jgi:KDO2-lipid IV(A) lauroyltransferase
MRPKLALGRGDDNGAPKGNLWNFSRSVSYVKAKKMRFLGDLLYSLLWTLGLCVYLLPYRVKFLIAYSVASFWFYVFPFRLKVILHNLALVFPRQPGESVSDFRTRCEALARANLRHMVLSFIEVLERFHWKKASRGKRFVVEGKENLKFHQDDPKKGFFCLTAHLGNWELITWVAMAIDVRLSIITRYLRNPFFDQLWRRSRYAFGLELLEESGSGLAVVRALKRGRAIGFIFDQHTGEPHGIESKFLGYPAWSPKALAIITAKLPVPILPAFVYRDERGVSHVVIEPPLAYRAESSEDALRYHVEQCNAKIGEWVRAHPDQYLWMHRRFKNFFDYRQALPW